MNRLPWGVLAIALTGCTATFNPESGRPYPCVADGGNGANGTRDTQCPVGWRCGFEGQGRCHDTSVVTDYLCMSDLDCEGGWRCGFQGRCMDASRETVPVGPSASFSATRVNPRWLASRPEHFAASFFNYFRPSDIYCDSPFPGRSFSLIADGGLIHEIRLAPDSGAINLPLQTALLPHRGFLDLAEWKGTAFALNDQGKVDVFPYDAGGFEVGWPGIPATRLRVSQSTVDGYGSCRLGDPLLVAFSAQQYAVGALSGFECDATGAFSRFAAPNGLLPLNVGTGCIPAGDAGCATIRDIAALDFLGRGEPGMSLVAATDQGLFFAPRSRQCPGGTEFASRDGGNSAIPEWQPLDTTSLPNAACGGGVVPRINQFRVRRIHGSALDFRIVDPATGFVYAGRPAMLELVPAQADPLTDRGVIVAQEFIADGFGNVACAGPFGLVDLGRQCPACPSKSRFVDAQLFSTRLLDAAETICAVTDDFGNTRTDVYQINLSDCSVQPIGADVAEDIGAVDRATSGPSSYAGAHGQLYLVENTLTERESVTLSELPQAVLRLGRDIAVVASDGGVWAADPVFGLQRLDLPNVTKVVATVVNRPEWLVHSDGTVTDSSLQDLVVAVADRTTDFSRGPYSAVTAALPDAGTELIMSAFDSLFAADVTGVQLLIPEVRAEIAADPDAGTRAKALVAPASVGLRAVPQARSPILQIAAVAGDAGVVSGYALTSNALIAFRGLTEQHWDSQTVGIPERDWVSVFGNGTTAFVGYGDGQVISLPSRIRLSPTLPTRAVDYAMYCGQIFVTSAGGVYRLAPSGNARNGQWVPVDLSAGLVAGTVEQGLAVSRLFRLPGSLSVATRFGSVVNLADTTGTCGP